MEGGVQIPFLEVVVVVVVVIIVVVVVVVVDEVPLLANQTCSEDAVGVLRSKDRLLDHVAQVASKSIKKSKTKTIDLSLSNP